MRINAGLFAAHSIDDRLDNSGWIAATRAVYSPMSGSNQLHFGANAQLRKFQSNNGATVATSAGQPSVNQLARYRARPFSQLTDVRFVDTGTFAAEGDSIFGLEAAGIFKSLHLAAEGQYLKTRGGYDAGTLITGGGDILTGLDQFASPTSVVAPGGNPSFWGGYVEAGYFLTGETRGYKNGAWDRTKVLKPFSKGGSGAFQINGRIDYLDLDSSKLRNALNANFVTGVPTLASVTSRNTRGGKQLGLLASLIWIPEDYMRFYLQYSHAFVTGGPFADEVSPTTPAADLGDEKYGVDFIGTRAQIDF
jgi:phosphate-selective porin OprO/OprP